MGEHRPDPGERLAEDLASLTDLADAGVEVDGEVQVEASTWVVYGHTSYDGEVVVGVYHDEAEATEVVHRAPHPGPHTEPHAGPDPGAPAADDGGSRP
jgi:hypothetical protein